MNGSRRVIIKMAIAVMIIAFLGGCKPVLDFFKKKTEVRKTPSYATVQDVDQGVVLLNIDGQPAITETEFNKHLVQMLQVNPYFKGASIDSLPSPLKRQFFDELVKQEVIIAWADKNNIDQDAEFQKSYEDMKKLVRRSLLVQRFETKLFEDIDVSDNDVEDFFHKNKDKFIKEPGGILVEGIEFDNNGNATAFYNKVKDNVAEFNKIAKSENKDSFKSFGRIEEKETKFGSNVPEDIKKKALSLSKLPAISKVKVDDKVWVICALDKKDVQYVDIDEVRDQLKSHIKTTKLREILDKKINSLKSGFTLDVNEDYFNASDQVN